MSVCGSDSIKKRIRDALNRYQEENGRDPKFIILNDADAEEAFDTLRDRNEVLGEDVIGEANKLNMTFWGIPVVTSKNSLYV